jgi:hypothetical protein
VGLVTSDVSENIPPPSSRFLMVVIFHSCVAVESLLVSLSIEGYYVGSRNPEDGGDIFSETSIITSAIRYRVPEDIYNHQSMSLP